MSNRPNILFCLADDAGKHQGAYGCTWVDTPTFNRVTRDGLVFDRAFTPNAKCAPSRASILTGRNPWQLENAGNHNAIWPEKFMSFMEALQQAGYTIGHTNKGWGPGDPGQRSGKPRELTGPAYNGCTRETLTACTSANDYPANFRAFLEAKPEEQPFCFWFGAKEPHRDYEWESGKSIGGRSVDEIDRVPGFWPDNSIVRQDLLDYGLEVEYFDAQVAAMLDLLEERGELDNTLVVITSDNGIPFPRIKGQEYDHSNELPMAMMWKNGIADPGRRVDAFVSFIDLAPTFLEIAGLDTERSGMQTITGQSLFDIFANKIEPADRAFTLIGKERHDCGRPHNQGYPIRGIFSGDWLYLRNYEPDRWPAGNPETGYLNCDGSPTKTEILKARQDPETRHFWKLCFGKRKEEELYHLPSDPDCLINLAKNAEHAPAKATLRAKMEGELTAQGDPRLLGNGAVFDQYPIHDPLLVDYHERFMNRHKTGECMEPGWISATDIEEVDEDGSDS